MLQAVLKSTTSIPTKLRQPPPDYASGWRLPFADASSYMEWSDGCLHMDVIYADKQVIQLFALTLRAKQRVHFTVTCSFMALWYVLAGSSRYLLEGLGNCGIKAGRCVLSFMPDEREYYADYGPGEHVFMCISLLPQHLEGSHRQLPQLRYFREHLAYAGAKAIQQPVADASDLMQQHFLLLLDGSNTMPVSQVSTVLMAEYQRLLLQRMQMDGLRAKHIKLAIEIKAYLDTSRVLNFTNGDVARRFAVNEYYAERSFKMLTGQTLGAYIKEQRLLYVAELRMHNDKRTKEFADMVGLSEGVINSSVRDRFGKSIKELLRTGKR